MHIYALISQKGGTGKSTLARQFAVLAGEAEPSLLIDRDPQRTTTKWWARRQDLAPVPERPDLVDVDGTSLTAAAAALRRKSAGTLFIDTRPAVEEPEAEAARVADLVIVPVRPSPDDLEAVGETLKILRRLEKRAVLIVNAAKTAGRATSARAALSRYPVPVCPIHVADRTVYLDASLEGRGVGEMRGAAAREALDELRQVWTWIQEMKHDQ
ncbi:MAG: ParA family protein [Rhodospirillales bacterium]|nr:ParA family protein [Rhodospirillales bacterium]